MFSRLPTASLTAADLLSGASRFAVPSYQRAYSWTRDEAGRLLDDLMAAAGLDDAASAEPDYFLGTILLMGQVSGLTFGQFSGQLPGQFSGQPPGESPADADVPFDIVDGQQRLVTLSILAAVLRDLDSAAENELWSRLDALVAVPGSGRPGGGPRRYRLVLAGGDQDFIERFMLAPGAAAAMPEGDSDEGAGAAAMLDVREHFLAQLRGLDGDRRRALAAYVCDRVHVVAIVTGDIDRAHRFFMVLNDRGRPLMRSDILKAEVLSALPPVRAEATRAAWDDASRSLGDRFDPFFSHLKAIHGITRPQVIAAVRSVVRAAGGAEPFVHQTVAPLAGIYRLILDPVAAGPRLPQTVVRALVHLGRLNGEEWVPAAMLAVRRLLDGDSGAERIVAEIDRQAHLMRFLALGADKRVRRFAPIIAAIRSGTPIDLDQPPFQPTRDEARGMAFNLQALWRRNPGFSKLVLLRLSEEIGGAVEIVDPALFSVEHVLPQRPQPTSEWRRNFPDAELREALTQSLGNLILVPQRQNDALRNKDFELKRAILARLDPSMPRLPLSDDVVAARRWGPDEIRDRESRLMKIVERMFRIDVKTSALMR